MLQTTAIVCQIVSALAAIAGVVTDNHVRSRVYRGTALATIASDYAVRSIIYHGEAAYLLGFATYAIPTIRTLSIAVVPRLDRDRTWRITVCGAALGVQFGLWVVISSRAFALLSLLPLAGFALAALGEVSNDMPTRRRFIFTIGVVMAIFAVETEAWGLLVKSLIADIGASLYAMWPVKPRAAVDKAVRQN